VFNGDLDRERRLPITSSQRQVAARSCRVTAGLAKRVGRARACFGAARFFGGLVAAESADAVPATARAIASTGRSTRFVITAKTPFSEPDLDRLDRQRVRGRRGTRAPVAWWFDLFREALDAKRVAELGNFVAPGTKLPRKRLDTVEKCAAWLPC
jgi:hypothetical protein